MTEMNVLIYLDKSAMLSSVSKIFVMFCMVVLATRRLIEICVQMRLIKSEVNYTIQTYVNCYCKTVHVTI